MHSRASAFTLLEIMLVMAVIGLLLALAAPVVGFQITQSQVAAETASLKTIAAAIQSSFLSTDLDGTNIAALPGTVPTGVSTTQFSTSTNSAALPASVASNDWFIKVARQMGYSFQGVSFPATGVPAQASGLVQNATRNRRILLVGPDNETTAQRFLLISLVGAPDQLTIPPLPNPANPQAPANLALFNDTWNTTWTAASSTLPATWTTALTAAQIQAWQGRLWQLCVQHITCPKYNVVINNTDATLNCYVYYNFNGSTAGSSLTVLANAGSQTSATPILYGRTIQAWRGTAAPPSAGTSLFSQFILKEPAEITLQN